MLLYVSICISHGIQNSVTQFFFLDYDRFGKDSDVSLMYIRNIRELVLECYLLINFKSISL